VNIILFAPDEVARPLAIDDPRARHVLEVLRRRQGDSFDAGIIDGPRGRATLTRIEEGALILDFEWAEASPPLEPITLIVGMPRPQTARKVLEDATSLGVSAIHFVTTESTDRGYTTSKVWTTDEWRRHVIAGAQQAFTTRLPVVTHGGSLKAGVEALGEAECRFALDNYEATSGLGDAEVFSPIVLAVGPERGWSDRERQLLRSRGFHLVHLGARVLRVETACVAAISVVRAKLGFS
jgi:RsmE family RNA methyltransferase